MKKIFFIVAFFLLIVIVLATIILRAGKSDLKIIENESFYSDFTIEGEKVYIVCELKIKNSSNSDKKFMLEAIMKDDVRIGLLKNEILQGYSENQTSSTFTLEKKSEDIFYVFFVGDFAGTLKKHDKNLPEIILSEVE